MKKSVWNWRLFFSSLLFFIAAAAINRLVSNSTGDLSAHLRFAQKLFTPENVISYPLFHMLVLLLQNIVSLKWAGILVQSGFCALTYYIVEYILRSQVFQKLEDSNASIAALLYAFLFAFCSPIYLPWVLPNIYLGQGGLQIWHNPTLTVAMPFALLLVYLFLKLFKQRKQNISITQFILFALLFVASNLAKPSFYIVFAPAVFLVLLVDVILQKFSTLAFAVKMGFSFVPATVTFLFQTFLVNENPKFSFSISPFTTWHIYSPSVFLSIVVGLAFPIAVVALLPKETWKNIDILFCILLNVIAILEFVTFTDGTTSGNFAWGYYMAQYALFIYAFILWQKEKLEISKWKNIGIQLVFQLHLLSGVCYLLQVFINGGYVVAINGGFY